MSVRVPDRYEVLEVVSDTPREHVVRARDTTLGRDVLIKAHAPGVLGSRALREARALARVDRPDVVRMIDVVDGDDGVLLVLEALAGETLAEHLAREGRLSAGETARLGLALADALAGVHRAGLVHRDVSPASVVLRPERGPCLSGFTFVKTSPAAGGTSLVFAPPDDAPDAPRAALPRFPAPEQWLGQGADPRADVFALGCTLYECLAGETPLPPAEERRDGGRLAVPPLAVAAPDAPPGLRRVVERCLAQSPLKRPADGAAVADALRAALAEAERAPSPAPVDDVAPPTRRAGLVTLLAAALVAVVFALTELAGPDAAEVTDTRGRRLRDPARAAALAPDYSASHALVIGIGDAYRRAGFPALPNAERDGHAVAEQLDAMAWEGWDVRTLIGEEATRVAILRELDALERAAGPDDRVLVFYAGHGEAHERSDYGGYLVPADARPLDDDPGRSSWISFGRLQDVFHQCPAKHILLCIDSCYSGRVTTPRTGTAAGRARTYLSQQAHLVLTSGRPFEQVSDGEPGRHSPFTRALLDCLTDADEPFLTTADVLVHMQDVFDAADVPHRPSLGHATGSTFGQVVFFPRAP